MTADLTWRPGDELVLLSRLPDVATAAVVEAAADRHRAPAHGDGADAGGADPGR